MKTKFTFFRVNRHAALVLAVIAALLAVTGALAAAGALDTTFDYDGIVVTDIGGDDWINAMAIQADGKIVVAGASSNLGEMNYALARYNSDGSLDTSFDGDGKVVTDIRDADYGYAITIQADGKVVVAGESETSSNADFSLARYNSDGSLDTTFDGDGKVVTDIGGQDGIIAMAIQADGQIVVTGFSNNLGEYNYALARYNNDGSLDTSFDGDGIVVTDIRDHDEGFAIAIQADGKIVVAGRSVTGSNVDFSLARYNSDGSLDTTFDGDGKVVTDIGGSDGINAMAIQADGRIVVAGFSDNLGESNYALARYNTDGSLDTGFDGDGKVVTDIRDADYGYAIAIQADGKIVVAGGSDTSGDNDFSLARYNTDGSLGTGFDGDGKVVTDIRDNDVGRAIAIQADGKIVVVGESDTSGDNDFSLARYMARDSGTLTFRSIGANDGWVLESSETSSKGGSISATASTLRLGDDAAKKQYRSILSFSTGASLPDTAVITKVTLKVKKQGITGGGNPVTAFQGFMVDIKRGTFGTSALQTADFQTAASKTYGPFKPTLSSNWYSIDLTNGKNYINKLSTASGLTQIRLRFKLDDNNNGTANYLSLYSGNASSSVRPQLIIEYYVP